MGALKAQLLDVGTLKQSLSPAMAVRKSNRFSRSAESRSSTPTIFAPRIWMPLREMNRLGPLYAQSHPSTAADTVLSGGHVSVWLGSHSELSPSDRHKSMTSPYANLFEEAFLGQCEIMLGGTPYATDPSASALPPSATSGE